MQGCGCLSPKVEVDSQIGSNWYDRLMFLYQYDMDHTTKVPFRISAKKTAKLIGF